MLQRMVSVRTCVFLLVPQEIGSLTHAPITFFDSVSHKL